MRVFAVSDIHADYQENLKWVVDISKQEYQEDVLIVAGDVSDSLLVLEHIFVLLLERFRVVLFVPGNHDLWVVRDGALNSLEKFHAVMELAKKLGVVTSPYRIGDTEIFPLLSWYDYSFGAPSNALRSIWADYHACTWPNQITDYDLSRYFDGQNDCYHSEYRPKIITFSHFLPRIDIMPSYIPNRYRQLYPVFGSDRTDLQIRRLSSKMHIYGHSHLNRDVVIEGVRYINNAFAYPRETNIALKALLKVSDVNFGYFDK